MTKTKHDNLLVTGLAGDSKVHVGHPSPHTPGKVVHACCGRTVTGTVINPPVLLDRVCARCAKQFPVFFTTKPVDTPASRQIAIERETERKLEVEEKKIQRKLAQVRAGLTTEEIPDGS